MSQAREEQIFKTLIERLVDQRYDLSKEQLQTLPSDEFRILEKLKNNYIPDPHQNVIRSIVEQQDQCDRKTTPFRQILTNFNAIGSKIIKKKQQIKNPSQMIEKFAIGLHNECKELSLQQTRVRETQEMVFSPEPILPAFINNFRQKLNLMVDSLSFKLAASHTNSVNESQSKKIIVRLFDQIINGINQKFSFIEKSADLEIIHHLRITKQQQIVEKFGYPPASEDPSSDGFRSENNPSLLEELSRPVPKNKVIIEPKSSSLQNHDCHSSELSCKTQDLLDNEQGNEFECKKTEKPLLKSDNHIEKKSTSRYPIIQKRLSCQADPQQFLGIFQADNGQRQDSLNIHIRGMSQS